MSDKHQRYQMRVYTTIMNIPELESRSCLEQHQLTHNEPTEVHRSLISNGIEGKTKVNTEFKK